MVHHVAQVEKFITFGSLLRINFTFSLLFSITKMCQDLFKFTTRLVILVVNFVLFTLSVAGIALMAYSMRIDIHGVDFNKVCKNTLETSEEDEKIHSKRVKKMGNYTLNE